LARKLIKITTFEKKLMTRIFHLFCCLFIYTVAKGQSIIEYQSASELDVTFNAVKSYGQNCIVGGNEGNKLLFCEINLDGTVVNSKTVILGDESTYPIIMSMILDSDNNIVVTGYRENTPSTATGFVLKYDFLANEVKWVKSFDNAGSYFHCIIEPIAGGDYVVSGQDFIDDNGQEAIIFKINRTTGLFTTITNINNGSNSETFYSIAYRDGSYQVSSRLTVNEGTSKMRACKLTLNDLGEITSNQTYLADPDSESARLYGFNVKYVNENILMAVHGDAIGTITNKDLFIVNTELDGEINWINKYDLLNYEFDGSWNSIVSDGANIFYFGNLKDGSVDEKGNIFIMKADVNGNIIWANSYNLETNYAYNHPDALLAKSSKLFAVGAKYNEVTNAYDGVILITNQEDGLMEEGCFTIEPLDYNSEILTSYNVISFAAENTFPISNPATTPEDAAFLAESITCQYVDINNSNLSSIFNIYPNPSHNQLTIPLAKNITKTSDVEIVNTSGLKIPISNGLINFFNNILIIDLNKIDLPAGFYLIKLNTNIGSMTYKFEHL